MLNCVVLLEILQLIQFIIFWLQFYDLTEVGLEVGSGKKLPYIKSLNIMNMYPTLKDDIASPSEGGHALLAFANARDVPLPQAPRACISWLRPEE